MCNQRHFQALEKDFFTYSRTLADLNTLNAQFSQLGPCTYNSTSLLFCLRAWKQQNQCETLESHFGFCCLGGFCVVFRFFFPTKKKRVSCLVTDPALGTRFLSCGQIKCQIICLMIKSVARRRGKSFCQGFQAIPGMDCFPPQGQGAPFPNILVKGFLLPPPLQSAAQTVRPQAVHWAGPGYAPLVPPVDNLSNPGLCCHRHCQKK